MISDGVLGKLPLDGTITLTSQEGKVLSQIGKGDIVHGLADYLSNQEQCVGNITTSFDGYNVLRYLWESKENIPAHPDRSNHAALDETTRARDILASLAAGTKLPESDLSWFLAYNEKKLDVHNEQRFWRNRKHDTVYKLLGCTLRVSDSVKESIPSPLMVSVDYTPNLDLNPSGRCVVFNRDLVSFLQKFQPVIESTAYIGSSIDTFPVHGITF